MRLMAPGVIKLLGEHSVVYGYTCIAAAIDLYVNAEVSDSGDDESLKIINAMPCQSKITLSKEELIGIFDKYGYKSGLSDTRMECTTSILPSCIMPPSHPGCTADTE